MRGRYGQPLRWTPERVAEAIQEWDRLGSSNAAAAELTRRWGERVTGTQIRCAVATAGGRPERKMQPASEPEPQREPPQPVRAPAQAPDHDPGTARLVAVLADLHVPDHDEGCLQAFERWALAAKPSEIIVAGDFLELESASEHPGSRPTRVEDDIAAGLSVMRRLLALCPRVTLRLGNHEDRAARIVSHRVPSMAARFTSPADEFRALGVQVDTRAHVPTRRDRLLVLHGDEFLRGRYPPLYHARKAVEVYAEPGTVIVYGHVHREQHFVRAMEMGNCEARSLPCMRTLDPAWLGPEVSGWSQGWAAVQLAPGRRPTLDVIRYESGAAYWGGQRI